MRGLPVSPNADGGATNNRGPKFLAKPALTRKRDGNPRENRSQSRMHSSGGDPSSTALSAKTERRGAASGFSRNSGLGRYSELRQTRTRPLRQIDRRALGVTRVLAGFSAVAVVATGRRLAPLVKKAMTLHQSPNALLNKSPRRLCSHAA
jgi:hypothetical protein